MEGVQEEGLLKDDHSEECELFVNTKGHCFLCLVKLEEVERGEGDEGWLEEFGGDVRVPKTVDKDESFQWLSRYLKLDLGRGRSARSRRGRCKHGVGGEGGIMGRCRNLKVPLCEVCTSITDQFLEVYRRLEQIELEMAYCLTRVKEKIVKAEETGLAEGWRSWRGREDEDDEEAGRELEIVEELRKETMEKCLLKLSPPVPVSSLPSPKNVTLKKEDPAQEAQDDDGDDDLQHDPSIFLEIEEDSSASSDNSSDHDNDDIDDPGEGEVDRQISSSNNNSSSDSEESFDDDYKDDPDFVISAPDPLSNISLDETKEASEMGEGSQQESSASPGVKLPPPKKKREIGIGHPASGKHQCDLCPNPKLFRDSRSLQVHHKSVHLNVTFSCPLCDKEFHYRRSYRRHHQEVHVNQMNPIIKSFKCLKCGDTFNQKSELKKHHKISPNCGEGGNQDVGSQEEEDQPGDDFSIPLPKSLGPPKHPCRLCGKQFIHSGHLNRHMTNVHLKIRRYKCDQCNKGFSQTEHLQRHVDTVHLKLRDHVCDQCGKGFSTPAHLRTHIISVHTELPRSFICDKCGKGYTSALNVRRHVEKVHLLVRESPCDLCGEVFEGRRLLKIHRRKVHNEIVKRPAKPGKVSNPKPRVRKPCPCTICGRIFTRSSGLNRHMEAVHYQLRKYACDKCSKSYKRKPDLLKHNCKGQVSPS